MLLFKIVKFNLQMMPIRDFLYELYAVIVHDGTLRRGHYYAYVNVTRKHDQEKWQLHLSGSSGANESTLKREVEKFLKEMRNKVELEITDFSSDFDQNLRKSNSTVRDAVDSNWFYVSDETVKKVPEKDVLSHKDAYILFYEAQ